MNLSLKEIELYLPKYLSPETKNDLFKNLDNLPKSFDMFIKDGSLNKEELLQGDGIIINMQNIKMTIMIISNSCDIDPNNTRIFESYMLYAPIFSIDRYRESLIKDGISEDKVNNHIHDIKKQKITQIFYIPKSNSTILQEDCFIFFDRINNISLKKLYNKNECEYQRIFSLSQTAFYIFLIKISINFTRMMEGIDRGKY